MKFSNNRNSTGHCRRPLAVRSCLIKTLELIQSHVAKQSMLRGEVEARAASVERGGMGERGGCVQSALSSGRGREADWGVLRSQRSEAFFVVVLPPAGAIPM